MNGTNYKSGLDFIGISQWQSAVAVAIFYLMIILLIVIYRFWKIKTLAKIFISIILGIIFGLTIQGILGFPKDLNEDSLNDQYLWVKELNNWVVIVKEIFINSIFLMTIPVVFVSIFRAVSKPNDQNLAKMSIKMFIISLVGIAVVYSINFWIGIWWNVGDGVELKPQKDTEGNNGLQSFPEQIISWMPTNIFGALSGAAIIPVMVIALLFGLAVKQIINKNPNRLQKLLYAFDCAWDIVNQMLNLFMKIIQYAIFAMIVSAIIVNPIGQMNVYGKMLAMQYIAIGIALIWITLILLFARVNIFKWWKLMLKTFLQAFSTSSSNATLPTTMQTLNEDLKVNRNVTSILVPLSVSIGMIAAIGAQTSTVLSLLYTSSADGVKDVNIWVFFLMGLVLSLIISIGVAGVPGSGLVVTQSIVSGVGFTQYTNSIVEYVFALDAICDMGRTSANVCGAASAITIVAISEGQIEEDSPVLTKKSRKTVIKRRENNLMKKMRN